MTNVIEYIIFQEDLMTETIVDKKAAKAQVYKFKSDLDKINQMIEDEGETLIVL